MSTTIRDVARVAGVSTTTVSHVLNGQGRVSKVTRATVERVAAELGYRANVHAQQLVTRRSRTLAIQVARMGGSTSLSLVPNSEYFLELLNGAAERADDLGYALILTPPGVSVETINAFGVDGAIIVDPRGDEPLFFPDAGTSRPLVTTGRPLDEPHPQFVVDNDHGAAAIVMLDHLHAQGFGRPALVVTDTSRSYTSDMIDGYCEWAIVHNVDPVVIQTAGPDQTRGADAVKEISAMDLRPDALYASSEDLAIDLLHELRRADFAVPEDMALASAVDSSALQLTRPTITGMALNPRSIGKVACDLVIDLVEQREVGSAPAKLTVPTQLLARESTARPGALVQCHVA